MCVFAPVFVEEARSLDRTGVSSILDRPQTGLDGGSLRARPRLEVPLSTPRGGSRSCIGRRSAERGDVEEPRQKRLPVAPLAVVDELVDKALAPAAAVHQDVLERGELVEMGSHLEVGPGGRLAHPAAREEESVTVDRLPRALAGDRAIEPLEEIPRLRRKLVERAAEDLVGETVGDSQVHDVDFDVGQGLPAVLDALERLLVLAQERHGADECQVLHVIAAGSRSGVEESELAGEGIRHQERLQEPLRVAVCFEDRLAVLPGEEPFERLRFALQAMDRPRLLAVLVDAQDETAIQQLFVDLDRRRRQEDRDRPLDLVLVGDEPARVRVLARRGDRQLAFAL